MHAPLKRHVQFNGSTMMMMSAGFKPGDLLFFRSGIATMIFNNPFDGVRCGDIRPNEVALCLCSHMKRLEGEKLIVILTQRGEIGYTYGGYFL